MRLYTTSLHTYAQHGLLSHVYIHHDSCTHFTLFEQDWNLTTLLKQYRSTLHLHDYNLSYSFILLTSLVLSLAD